MGKTVTVLDTAVCQSEHPHICGENRTGKTCGFIVSGTSPHLWGKHIAVRYGTGYIRNIPTSVGKTRQSGESSMLNTEHPHICGENGNRFRYSGLPIGTSPHLWGKPIAATRGLAFNRNIPTSVGKTCAHSVADIVNPGTSPHLWGKRWKLSTIFIPGRNIPTSVGKPQNITDSTPVTGTSPHLWGKLTSSARRWYHTRNIPTSVGKTTAGKRIVFVIPEHPHICGENVIDPLTLVAEYGTSPHLWGKLLPAEVVQPCVRNIPTSVGKTPCHLGLHRHEPEHPHICGENTINDSDGFVANGTSPHLWGKP